ncbi:porin [Noviherbaspirillum sedimenti]|uniref:Porin n=1 Tax=Noviherbaspirillum sedimenti TaxID=2320865 RepID=A0A3A3GRN4_9BURK|nr:porin [Noviherbaspirillum sedimenti]RJG03610.1 porin [Noviherbaspirillum sedimenti]
MKKSLLALAVLGAFTTGSQAQTNVSIGGILHANVKNYKISNSARQTSNELRVDDDLNSRFWLTGTEDLGGGLKALFYVENRFNADQPQATGTGAGLANGETYVGLKGGWGQITVGKHSWMSTQGLTTEYVSASGNNLAIPTSMLATYSIMDQAVGNLDTTRRANSVTYRSPVVSGFSGVAGISTASAGNEGVIDGTSTYEDGREYYLQGGYNNGPLALALAYRDFTAEGRAAGSNDDQQLRFHGSYKFGGIKLGLMADRASREAVGGGKSSRTAWSIPVSYTLGNNTFLASFTKAGDLSAGNANLAANTGNDTGAKMYTVGYDYALSKRTNVGVYYSRLDNDANGVYQPFNAGTSFTGSSLVAGETASTLALGVKHTF